jgi:hypothetical protein
VVLALQIFKDRRCSTCTEKEHKKFGCDTDVRPFYFDGEKINRCPLRPYKDDPGYYSELFKLYSFREKNVMAEVGGFYDQPNFYVEAMSEMDSALNDVQDVKEHTEKLLAREEDKKTNALAERGIVFTPKE